MQFLASVLFASLLRAGNSGRKDLSRLGDAIASSQQAPELVIGGNVIRVIGEQSFEVGFRCGGIPFFHALHGQAVAAEGVERIFFYELFENLPAFCACLGRAHIWRIIAAGIAGANAD